MSNIPACSECPTCQGCARCHSCTCPTPPPPPDPRDTEIARLRAEVEHYKERARKCGACGLAHPIGDCRPWERNTEQLSVARFLAAGWRRLAADWRGRYEEIRDVGRSEIVDVRLARDSAIAHAAAVEGELGVTSGYLADWKRAAESAESRAVATEKELAVVRGAIEDVLLVYGPDLPETARRALRAAAERR